MHILRIVSRLNHSLVFSAIPSCFVHFERWPMHSPLPTHSRKRVLLIFYLIFLKFGQCPPLAAQVMYKWCSAHSYLCRFFLNTYMLQ